MMNVKPRFSVAGLLPFLIGLLGCLAMSPALSQPASNKPLHLIVPAPAGGGFDKVARVVGQKVSENLNIPVIIEKKAGA